MEFKKYQHVERLGTDEVEGIEKGVCYVFPKIDGTNGTVFLDENGKIKAGSRKRELTLEKDNHGFYAYVVQDKRLEDYLKKHPNHRLFGEWLVHNTLRTYKDDAWKKFYIFDVIEEYEDGTCKYLPYEEYKPLLEEFNLEYIPPIAKLTNPSYEDLIALLDKNTFLIKEGQGFGEGVVIKNYNYKNKYGRQTWAKIVRSEFKEKVHKSKKSKINTEQDIEEQIVEDFVTEAFIKKEYAKIINEKEGWRSEYIPMLLSKIFYTLITEEMWHIIKKYKKPTINFHRLNALVVMKIKETLKELF